MSTEDTKVVVITGGTGYVGSVIARALYQAGYVPVVLTRSSVTQMHPGIRQSIRYVTADITDLQSLMDAAQQVASEYGKVYALVHAAAAPLVRKPFLALTIDEAVAQFAPQTTGAFQFFKLFVPLLHDGGRVIGLTTVALEPGATYAPSGAYVAAKGALRGMLRTLSHELSERSVAVCAVAPAFMPGGLNGDMPEAVIELLTKKSAPEDITTPEQVAKTVLAVLGGELEVSGKSVRVPGRAMSDL